jgi:hypothetical protein
MIAFGPGAKNPECFVDNVREQPIRLYVAAAMRSGE